MDNQSEIIAGEWTGNILSNEGAWFAVGIIRAHIVRRARESWMKLVSADSSRPWKRAWIIAIYNDDPFRIDGRPLVELIDFNVMPNEVRRTAETLAEWAHSHFSAASAVLDQGVRDAEK